MGVGVGVEVGGWVCVGGYVRAWARPRGLVVD